MSRNSIFESNVLLVVVVATAIAGIFLWLSHVDPVRILESLKSPEEVRTPESGTKAPPIVAAAKAHRESKSTAAPAPEQSSPEQAVPQQAIPQQAVPQQAAPVEPAPVPEAIASAVPQEPLPFPSPEQINAGVQEEAITSKYGDPTVSTLTSRGGHVMQTFVYTRDGGHTATVIQLEDGKVASAYTKATPAPATGVSAPRR